MEKTGSPTGSGNPPGKHSKSYLSPNTSKGHFVKKSSYRADSGRVDTSTFVGNQPKMNSESSIGMRTKAI